MELKHLNTFLVLSEIKNFTKTAEYLNYAQSSVTTQIQQLEKDLNVRLFDRIGKNVVLTLEGEKLIPYATKMLSLSSNIKKMYANTENSGRIIIGASESISTYRLPKIITLYKEKHPNVDLFLIILDSSDFIPLLANNTIDIAFTMDHPTTDKSTTSFLNIDESICVLSKPEHPLALKKNVSIQDFANIPMILTGHGCCYRTIFERDLSMFDISPKIVLETSSIHVIKQTALSGLGLCILPELTVENELNDGTLVKLSYETNYNIVSQLICHKDKWISQNLRDFITVVESISY